MRQRMLPVSLSLRGCRLPEIAPHGEAGNPLPRPLPLGPPAVAGSRAFAPAPSHREPAGAAEHSRRRVPRTAVGLLAVAGLGLAVLPGCGGRSDRATAAVAAAPGDARPGPAGGTDGERGAVAPREAGDGPSKPADTNEKPLGPDVRPRLVVQMGHTSGIRSAAFSPDGKRLLTGSDDHTARLWDVASGKELRTFAGYTNWVWSVACSPDGHRVLTGGMDGTAELWDASSGEEVRTFRGHTGMVYSVAFSPDGGLILTGGNDGTARVWDAETGRQIHLLDGHVDGASGGGVFAVAFSPDGPRALSSGIDGIRLWNAESGKLLGVLPNTGSVRSAAFSPDGHQVITGSQDNTAQLWNVESGKRLRTFEGHTYPVLSAAFSPDGRRVLTGSNDETARLWDADTGKEVQRFKDYGRSVLCVAFTPDGRGVLTGDKDSARLWDVDNADVLREFEGHTAKITDAGFFPDGRRLLLTTSAGNGRPVMPDAGKEVVIFPGRTGSGSLVALSPDRRRVLWNAWSWHVPTQLADAETGALLFSSPRDQVMREEFSPDGRRILLGCGDGTVWLLDADSGKELHDFHEKGQWAEIAFSPDGRRILTAGHGGPAVHLWDADSGRKLHDFLNLIGPIDSVAFSPDGHRILATGYCGPIDSPDGRGTIDADNDYDSLWDADSGKKVRNFPGHGGAFTPDGRRILIRDGEVARVYDTEKGEELRTLQTGGFRSAAFAPDGLRILLVKDHTACLRDAETGKELCAFVGHTGEIESAAFSPDGRRVLTWSDDATVRLWEADTGRELCAVVAFRDGGWAVVTPEGRFDTSEDLESLPGLHWVMPDEPNRPWPVELFLRDYYEPRLLSRLLAGEDLPPIRSVAQLDRARPAVSVAAVEPQPGQDDEVAVTVEVAQQTLTVRRDGRDVEFHSGAFDLQLFRDGHLVAARPEGGGPVALDPKTGKASVRFEHVRLPRRKGQAGVEFSAYAFNVDRVKSDTARRKFTVPAGLEPRQGSAYVVCVGVNAFDSRDWDLRYAAADARDLAQSLQKSLESTGRFERVVTVPLVSEDPAKSTATKADVRSALALLAGRPIDAAARERLPAAAAGLAAARPEDLVLLAFSTHGYNGKGGVFYLFPSDIGAGHPLAVTDDVLARAVSSDELTEWLGGVDAGQMAVVIDACHSAASVEGGGFKPGPLGSRGLGQLAYSKRMRVLAASAADQAAREDSSLGHGLLTYALCDEGLAEGRAAAAAAAGRVTLGGWLRYGAARVPGLAADVDAGRPKGAILKQAPGGPAWQLPALFDFSRGPDDVVLGDSPAKK